MLQVLLTSREDTLIQLGVVVNLKQKSAVCTVCATGVYASVRQVPFHLTPVYGPDSPVPYSDMKQQLYWEGLGLWSDWTKLCTLSKKHLVGLVSYICLSLCVPIIFCGWPTFNGSSTQSWSVLYGENCSTGQSAVMFQNVKVSRAEQCCYSWKVPQPKLKRS